MKYSDGSELLLGDIVRTHVGPRATTRGRVVMVGDTLDHLEIEEKFVSWVKAAHKLASNQVIIEFLEKNPFANDEPNFAPVGDYMFTSVDGLLIFESRP